MFGRNTEPVRAYPLHQDEVRAQQADDPLEQHAHGHLWRQWLKRLPEIHLRYAEPDITQRNLHFAGDKPVVQEHAPYTPPIFGLRRAQGDTEDNIPVVSNPKTPIPVSPSGKLSPQALPDWLTDLVKDRRSGALPVEQATPYNASADVPAMPPHITGETPAQALAAVDEIRHQALAEIPTWHPGADFDADAFLLATGVQSTSALEQLSMLASQQPDDDTVEVQAITKKKHTQTSDGLLFTGVRMTTDDLSTPELAQINLSIEMGTDPRQYPWYEKAMTLFTEEDGTKMHQETRRTFASIVMERIERERA